LSDDAISMVLLLGSYDAKTKAILDNIKEEIAKQFSGKPFAFLLASIEIYMTDRFQVLTEIEEGKRITIYLFENNTLCDVYDLPVTIDQDQQQAVYDFLSRKFDISQIKKQTVMQKFGWLMTLSKAIYIIREKELTRGGEYVELMHTLYVDKGEKVWFFAKNSIEVSSMLMEYLDAFKVKMRPYFGTNDLMTSIIRLVGYLQYEK
jgi:hypothetical protein